MPNHFVFNQSAEDFKVQIYGVNAGSLTPIEVGADGGLAVSVLNTADVSVVNTPSVNVANTAAVSVLNTPSVLVSGVAAVSDTATVTTDSTGTVLAEDTSQQREYSYYINNASGPAVSVILQVAPIDDDAYYANDTSTVWTVAAGTNFVTAPQHYLHYTRLNYDAGSSTASFVAYYNAQV